MTTAEPTPLDVALQVATRAGCYYECPVDMKGGRVILGSQVIYDETAPEELNATRVDCLRMLLRERPIQRFHAYPRARALCAICGAPAVGIDLERALDVCEDHRP